MRRHDVDVFVDADGFGGNALAVFVPAPAWTDAIRAASTRQLELSETVFVDDVETGRVSIYSPSGRLAFAGHPLVGAAWVVMADAEAAAATLVTDRGPVRCTRDAEWVHVEIDQSWIEPPPLVRLQSLEELAAATGPPDGLGVSYLWTEDPCDGVLHARMLAPALGIPEDEATGSAAAALAVHLGKDVVVRQGRGSEIACRHLSNGRLDLSGRVRRRRSASPAASPINRSGRQAAPNAQPRRDARE